MNKKAKRRLEDIVSELERLKFDGPNTSEVIEWLKVARTALRQATALLR